MTLTTALLLAWMKVCAVTYGVEPEFALAVAAVESRPAGYERVLQMRTGPLGRKGKYYGPMGIHRDFLEKWPIDDPLVNIHVGVRALRGKDKRRVLRRYNAKFNEAYYRAVRQAYQEAKKNHIFR